MAHHPPYILIGETWYFITASALGKSRVLKPTSHKQKFTRILFELADFFSINIFAWVVLDNHYHLLMHVQSGNQVSEFIRRLHGRSAYEMNKLDGKQGRQVWHNYWDQLVETERDFWTRFNYIHHNPVKHGYVSEAPDWEFSSYAQYLKEQGEEWITNVWRNYPIVDFTIDDEFEAN